MDKHLAKKLESSSQLESTVQRILEHTSSWFSLAFWLWRANENVTGKTKFLERNSNSRWLMPPRHQLWGGNKLCFEKETGSAKLLFLQLGVFRLLNFVGFKGHTHPGTAQSLVWVSSSWLPSDYVARTKRNVILVGVKQCQGVATRHFGTGYISPGGKSSQHFKRIHSSLCKVRGCFIQILPHFKQL